MNLTGLSSGSALPNQRRPGMCGDWRFHGGSGERRLGDKTALSEGLLPVADGLSDRSIIFTATSSRALQEVGLTFLLFNANQSKCILKHFSLRLGMKKWKINGPNNHKEGKEGQK